jgi:hypothetical protein
MGWGRVKKSSAAFEEDGQGYFIASNAEGRTTVMAAPKLYV